MLRRLARVLRIGLLLLGTVFAGLIVIGQYYIPSITLPLPYPYYGVVVSATQGCAIVLTVNSQAVDSTPSHYGSLYPYESGPLTLRLISIAPFRAGRLIWLPRFGRGRGPAASSQFVLWLPLWLLAAVCLAWPVASFILARRRRKRGFPVEPTDASDSEAPKVRSNKAQGASAG